MEIIICGDQTVDVCPFLAQALVRKRTPLLQTFFQRIRGVLEEEINLLPWEKRTKIPHFSNLRGLVDEYSRGGVHIPSLESAFTCLAQLSHFIG